MMIGVEIAVYTPDLMDRSKISSVAPDARFVTEPEALVGLVGVDLAVVDLRQPRVLDVLADIAAAVPVIAYGSHVDRDRLAAAEAAGCRQVLARSAFFSRLAELLAQP
jgi:hypothetical protein